MHLAGKLNVVADSISHNIFPMQSIQLSQQPMPDPIPSPLWQLLVTERPDWTYVNWRELLRTSAKQSLNINSQRAYHAAQKQYIEFCQSFQIVPLPATEQVLILFVADLSSRVCHVTAWSYLSAVRHLHISNGYGDPLKGALQLELVLRGLRHKKPRGQGVRLPITPLILMHIRDVLMQQPHDFNNIMMICLDIWAICTKMSDVRPLF